METGTSILPDYSMMTANSLLCHPSASVHHNIDTATASLPQKQLKRKETHPETLPLPSSNIVRSKRLRPPSTGPSSNPPVLQLSNSIHLHPHPCAQPYLVGQFSRLDDASPPSARALVSALYNVLSGICTLNAATPRKWSGMHPYHSPQFPDGSASIFYSLTPPRFNLHDYVARLVRYLQVSRSVFVAALVLLDRGHAADDALALTNLNVHRLLTTALGIATKFLEDESYRNSTIGRIGGIPSTAEMNLLEAQFLRRIRWHCSVSPQTFELYERNMFGSAQTESRD